MSESNFGSDLSKIENQDESKEAEQVKKSKKRMVHQISNDSSDILQKLGFDDHYEAELKKRKESKDVLDEFPEERIFINLQKAMKREEILIEDSQESLVSQSPTNPSNFWINKLKYYPSDAKKENAISFRELLNDNLSKLGNQRNTLESAFFTSLNYDLELIEPLLKNGIKVTLVTEPQNPTDPKVDKNVLGYSNFTIVKLPKNNFANFVGLFRAKLTILKFSHFLRVVIGTGNLSVNDWTIWENCLWFRDFPMSFPTSLSQEKKKPKKRGRIQS